MKKLAYLLILKKGARPTDKEVYVNKVIETSAPEAKNSHGASVCTRWQVGAQGMDLVYAFTALVSEFGNDAMDTTKYEHIPGTFKDDRGDEGLLLKVVHRA